MQAIRTQYRGPTDRTGSRIIASADAGRVTVPYDHALDSEGNHNAACDALRHKLGWCGVTVSGMLPDGSHAHVFVTREG